MISSRLVEGMGLRARLSGISAVKVTRYRRRTGLPVKDTYAPDERLKRKAGRCAQS